MSSINAIGNNSTSLRFTGHGARKKGKDAEVIEFKRGESFDEKYDGVKNIHTVADFLKDKSIEILITAAVFAIALSKAKKLTNGLTASIGENITKVAKDGDIKGLNKVTNALSGIMSSVKDNNVSSASLQKDIKNEGGILKILKNLAPNPKVFTKNDLIQILDENGNIIKTIQKSESKAYVLQKGEKFGKSCSANKIYKFLAKHKNIPFIGGEEKGEKFARLLAEKLGVAGGSDFLDNAATLATTAVIADGANEAADYSTNKNDEKVVDKGIGILNKLGSALELITGG